MAVEAVLSMSPTMKAVVVVLGMTLVVQIIRKWLSLRAYFNVFNQLPTSDDFSWIWGNLHKIRGGTKDAVAFATELTRKFPKMYCQWFGAFQPSVVVHHPDTIKSLLKTSEPKPFIYKFVIPWLGEGLLIAKGAKWARSRRLLSPAFHFEILKPYVKVANRATDLLLNKLERYAEEKKAIEMYSNISLCTLDTIMRCAMSYSDNIQNQGESHPYVQAVKELTDLWTKRVRNPMVRSDFIYGLTKNGRRFHEQCDFVHSISDRIIKERQQSLEREGAPKKRYLDFLDILLTAKDDTGEGLTPLEIRNEVDTFMFAGHDTTASSLSWTLYSLSEHPEYQRKAQEEIDSLLKGRQSDDIEWDDLSKLEYLTMVIKEGMRLHCPVPIIGRQLTQPATVEGVTLPVGTVVSVNIINLHHNPTVWSDPWTFRPDRFHPDNCKDRDSYAFVPFSAGPRNCIGQHFSMNEQKVILGRLLRKYTFSPDPQNPASWKMAGTMASETGVRLFATPRKPTM